MEKQELIAGLKEIMPVMDKLIQYDKKLGGIEQRITHLSMEINRPYKTNILTWGIGFMVGSYVAGLVASLFKNSPGFILLLGCCICLGIVAAGIIASIKIGKQLWEKSKESLKQELEKRKKEYEKVEQEMFDELAPSWDKVQAIVPQDYISPLFVKTVYSYLVNGRADSMKEAINLFEEEQHRWRMEESQQYMYHQYQSEIQNLQEVAKDLELRLANAEHDAYVAKAYATKSF